MKLSAKMSNQETTRTGTLRLHSHWDEYEYVFELFVRRIWVELVRVERSWSLVRAHTLVIRTPLKFGETVKDRAW